MECPGNSYSGHKAFPPLPSHSQHLISYFKIRKMQYLYLLSTGESQAPEAIKAYGQVSLPQCLAELPHPSGTLLQARGSQLTAPLLACGSQKLTAHGSAMQWHDQLAGNQQDAWWATPLSLG